ncbi:hypothetical protein HanPSC8_Chr06g0247691 [Helianthus annuus]|nr:hypothetical protein HanPSC8_Chr06g0247691 [Helianthus annuus]
MVPICAFVFAIFIRLDVDAFLGLSPHRLENRGPVDLIKLTQDRFDCVPCLLCMIMWNVRDQMMQDMSVGDIMENPIQESEIPINCR